MQSLSLFLSRSLSLQWKTGHFSPNTLISLAFLIFDLPEKCQNQSHNKDWKFHYLQLEVHIIILICINIGTCVAQNFIKHILNTFVHCSKLTQLHTEFTENLAKHKHYHMKVKTNSQIIYYRNMVKFLCIYTVKLGLFKNFKISEYSRYQCPRYQTSTVPSNDAMLLWNNFFGLFFLQNTESTHKYSHKQNVITLKMFNLTAGVNKAVT